jgi:hypothetical protein
MQNLQYFKDLIASNRAKKWTIQRLKKLMENI